MRVTFVLPGPCGVAAGGPRMVLRYANALAAAGWSTTVVMVPGLRDAGRWRRIARRGRYWLLNWTHGYRPDPWQPVDSRVRLAWLPDLHSTRAPDGDAVVATSVQTAEAVASWPSRAGRGFYFVQGYETWDFSVARVQASWRLPLRVIAVSRWLVELARSAGVEALHLPNGLDHSSLGIDRAPDKRLNPTVIFPWHTRFEKGAADALSALAGIAAERPGSRIMAFGTDRGPSSWRGGGSVEYHRSPSPARLRALLNEAQVAIAPSHAEGWGLPACEALQCGCGLAASDIGGHREFLTPGRNALLHAPKDIRTLRRNVERLLADSELRHRLAEQGAADMKRFSVDESAAQLRDTLRSGCAGA